MRLFTIPVSVPRPEVVKRVRPDLKPGEDRGTASPKPGDRPDAMDVDDAEEQLNNVEAAKLKTLADKINNFVNDEGTLEGAKFQEWVAILKFLHLY